MNSQLSDFKKNTIVSSYAILPFEVADPGM